MELREKPIELKSSRVLDSDLLEAALVKITTRLAALKPGESLRKLNYRAIGGELHAEQGINPDTAKFVLSHVFPQREIAQGKTPDSLLKSFLKVHPSYLIPTKLRKASELLTANPNMPTIEVARRVGLSEATIRNRLKELGIRFTEEERFRRSAEARGITGERKNFYWYYSRDTVEKVAEALQRNQNQETKAINFEKAVLELSQTMPEVRARRVIESVFTKQLLEKRGIQGCLDTYLKWHANHPRKLTNLSKERQEMQPEYNKRRREMKKRKHTESISLHLLAQKVHVDSSINDKQKFMRVATQIVKGRTAFDIAKQLEIGELAVIGIRRRVLDYAFENFNYKKTLLFETLKDTAFWNTFVAEWSSPQFRDYVTREGPSSGLRSTEYIRVVEEAFNEAMHEKKPLAEPVKKVVLGVGKRKGQILALPLKRKPRSLRVA
ncbi:MAG: hypothetical protein COT15_00930 [Candidatus Diapherotrites archaeon CG08_land_8_20_14_0_20_34_12]|nr:MAG: hypothetical protein COT15_00930 [Candidatus Diapherotrites archaeon CG08_land_8_20_14_0_20_34_12]